MEVLGITGPTGAGKTTALQVVEHYGGRVLDADAIYHQMLEEDPALRAALESRFGSLTGPDGSFQRKRLGAVVFADPTALEELNQLVQPFLQQKFRYLLERAEREGCPLAAIDAVRLVESGLGELCRSIVAITAPKEVRVARIMAREGISAQYAWARVNAQPEDAFYREKGDILLVNDCPDRASFQRRVEQALEPVLRPLCNRRDCHE